MPLFECAECGVAENTALCNFWEQYRQRRPPLCSQCDPYTGKWHNEFQRTPAAEVARAEMHSNPTCQWMWWDGSEFDNITAAAWLAKKQHQLRVPRPYHMRIQIPERRRTHILYERSNWQPADLEDTYTRLLELLGSTNAEQMRRAMERFAESPTTSHKGGSLTLPNGHYATWRMWRSQAGGPQQ